MLGISRAALYEKIKKLRMAKAFDEATVQLKIREKKRDQ